MNRRDNHKIMSNNERFKRFQSSRKGQVSGLDETSVVFKKTNYNLQPMVIHDTAKNGHKANAAAAVAPEDEPFFSSNLGLYPGLPQPMKLKPYQTYKDWHEFTDQSNAIKESPAEIRGILRLPNQRHEQLLKEEQREQLLKRQQHQSMKPVVRRETVKTNAEIWQQVGKNVCQWTQHPDGQTLLPVHLLVKLNSVELACVLMAGHLLKQRNNSNKNSISHFNEIRSFVVMSDEVIKLMDHIKERNCNTHYSIPYQEAPMPTKLPVPPTVWLQDLLDDQKNDLQKQKHLKKLLPFTLDAAKEHINFNSANFMSKI